MSAAQAPAPTITRAGNRAATRHKLFVNVPVRDLQRAVTFFEALGFAFSPQFTDAQGTCMPVGEDAYVMLLTEERFMGFSKRPLPDRAATTGALLTVSVESREAVEAMVRRAIAAGGAHVSPAPEDHGFMYEWDFEDPEGHRWGVFWMDPAVIPADA